MDGFYYIVGRKKRFLKLYGNRVSLDEVEQLIKESGYDCACAGSDDNLNIYLTDPGNKTKILSYISEITGINQAGFNSIFIDKIPRNESGKVIYSALE